MQAERWQRIEDVLQRALDVDASERTAFVRSVCGPDEELRREVDALLRLESAAAFLSARASLRHPDDGDALVGRNLGHYRIERRIGAGGMGVVYQARDERLLRTVAVKALPAEFTADPVRVRRFEQEALAASRLNHPNIITIHEVLHDEGALFIVAELVEGRTLRARLKEAPPRFDEALAIAIQIANALHAAHAAGIVHRDIKPENVMVRGDGVVKVLDFGIAKLSEDETPDARQGDAHTPPGLTATGTVLGTARYMSPEQARGESPDGRSDLYSLGVVLEEMTGGMRVPKAFQAIIRRLLQPRRDARPPSAHSLLRELKAVERRLQSRTARRIIIATMIAALAAIACSAWLSVTEVWQERILRDGHTAAAREVVFSPDGRILASCAEDGQVLLWHFARRERVATLAHPAVRIAFSPDGRWLATGSRDGSVAVWDVIRQRTIRTLRERHGEIGAIAFTPDGALLAASSAGRTTLWDTAQWRVRHDFPYGGYGSFLFSDDVRQLVLSPGWICYDLPSGTLTKDDGAHANGAALSPDRGRMATIDPAGMLSFYRLRERGNLHDKELIFRRHAHQDHGRSIAYSPDGRMVATAAEDILLWNGESQQKIARFEYPAIVWSVAFSPDGRWLVSSHADGAVLVWDVAERERVASLNEHSGAVRAVAFSSDGRTIASGGEDRSVTLWDVQTGRKRAVLMHHRTRVTAVAFGRDGTLASADQNAVTVLWNVAARRPGLQFRREHAAVLAAAVAPDGRTLTTSTGLYTREGRTLIDFVDRPSYMWTYGVAYSTDGRRMASVTENGWVQVWDPNAARLVDQQKLDKASIITVSFSPGGRHLVTGEDEGAIRLWEVAPLREVAILGRHAARVKSVAFSPDGETVASAADDKVIALWDVARRELRTRIGTHVSPVYSIAFSPDGRQLVSGEHDRTVRVYTRQRTLWGREWE